MDMTERSSVAAMIAKQQAHARHAPLLQTATSLPQDIMEMSVATCFERQAAQFPQHTAVVSAQGALPYQQLNQKANRLAHHLLALGIAMAAPVAIILEQSADTVVSILGVIKAGGCYFCLEPALPVPHTQDLLQRSATQTIITTSAFAAYAEQIAPAGSRYIMLDQMATSELAHNPDRPISPHDPLALNFTSGSTGTPKVTQKSHAAQLYGAWQCSIDYRLSPADRHTSIYQLNAGLSSRTLFAALFTGGAIYLYPGMKADMGGWATWLEAEAITQLSGPTAAIRELMYTRADGPNFPAMRIVQVAGQTVYRHDAELFQRRFAPGAILISLYGMTETATITHYLVDHDTRFEADTLPIGYPVAGRQLLVIDEAGNPLIDQPGELVMRHRRGHELLLGDVLDPRQRAQERAKEVDEEAYTLFHTADIGIQRPDGCLTYLGRKDDMVKVRGNRVTLTEIESWLLKVTGVTQAAAKAFPTSSGDNRVVGYVTLAPACQITEAAIRADLSQSIPFHMIPARVVVLATMPMTTTGKVDRKALPLPDATRPALATPFVAPRNEIEQQIADLWATLLGLDEIGVDDNFFDLGGDSLNAVRMLLTLEAKTGARIPQDYLRKPTVAALAQFCAADAVNAPNLRDSTNLVIPAAEFHQRTPRKRQPLLRRLATGKIPVANMLRRTIHTTLPKLSYTQGIAWLNWWARPAIANRLFHRERQWFYTLAQEMDNPGAATDATFATSILSNLIRHSFQRRWVQPQYANIDLLTAMREAPENFWRTFSQQFDKPTQAHPGSQSDIGPRFHVHGLEHFDDAQKAGRGIILLTFHGAVSIVAGAILSHQYDINPALDVSLEEARHIAKQTEGAQGDGANLTSVASGWAATQALHAQRILQQGGIVRFASDMSYDEPNSFTKTIGQRQYHLKPGFAELALTTDATVLPFYSNFDSTEGFHLTILPPLRPPSANSESDIYIKTLLDQYVAFLATTWRELPTSVGWGSLYYYSQHPRVGSSTQTQLSPQFSPP